MKGAAKTHLYTVLHVVLHRLRVAELLSITWSRSWDFRRGANERELTGVRLEGLVRGRDQLATAVPSLRRRRDVGVSLGVEDV